MQFQDKFIAYVDILGFTRLVEQAERRGAPTLSELVALLERLYTASDRETLSTCGPTLCPNAPRLTSDIDFQVCQMSDGLLVSSEVSPAGVINLVAHCWKVVTRLLEVGVLCRGFITRGAIYHKGCTFVGSGWLKAYHHERHVSAFSAGPEDQGTPFVEVDKDVRDYATGCGDACVRIMFDRMVRTDGELTALFPFQRLVHITSLTSSDGARWNLHGELESNRNMRRLIETMKAGVGRFMDGDNPKAAIKCRHYIDALDVQLRMCDDMDRVLRAARDA